jgi:LacI family transcriptional regulator
MSRSAAVGKTVTIRDVAMRARTSAGTVSRVLNGAPSVKDAVRRRVEAAIHELQYVPNAQARALSSKAFHTIAAVIPTVRNLNFVIFVRALQESLAREGYTLLFSSHEFDMRVELDEVRAFLARGLDGVVLVGQEHAPDLYAALAQRHVPYVTTWTLPREQESECVGVDNFEAAARLTRYLLDLGHKEFALVASLQPTNDRNALRLQGVKAELARAGIELRNDRILEGTGSIEEGKHAIRQLAAWKRRPTAVICVNDFLAFGALLECQALGIGVPGEPVRLRHHPTSDHRAHAGRRHWPLRRGKPAARHCPAWRDRRSGRRAQARSTADRAGQHGASQGFPFVLIGCA